MYNLFFVFAVCFFYASCAFHDFFSNIFKYIFTGVESVQANAQTKQFEQQNIRLKEALLKYFFLYTLLFFLSQLSCLS